MTATWTSHYEANGFMWWALDGTDWIVERVRRDDGRYVYECRLGRVAQLSVCKSDLVLAQRYCERDGAALVMPWEAS